MASRLPSADSPPLGVRLVVEAWRRAGLATLVAAGLFAVWLGAAPRSRPALTLALILAAVVLGGALWRLALREGLGPGGLQLGAVELRLTAVVLLTALFLAILGALASIVVLGFAYAAAASGHGFVASDPGTWRKAIDPRGRAVLVVVGAACAGGLAWSWSRIALAAPVSVARSRVQVLASWPASRGLVVPILAVAALAAGLLALGAWMIARLEHAGLAWPARGAAGLLLAGVWAPLIVGLLATVHRRSPAGAAS